MDDHLLIAKANQIAAFFAPYTEEEAVICITEHIRQFWEPRMRRALLASFDEGQRDGMHELVVAAVTDHRMALEPVTS